MHFQFFLIMYLSGVGKNQTQEILMLGRGIEATWTLLLLYLVSTELRYISQHRNFWLKKKNKQKTKIPAYREASTCLLDILTVNTGTDTLYHSERRRPHTFQPQLYTRNYPYTQDVVTLFVDLTSFSYFCSHHCISSCFYGQAKQRGWCLQKYVFLTTHISFPLTDALLFQTN